MNVPEVLNAMHLMELSENIIPPDSSIFLKFSLNFEISMGSVSSGSHIPSLGVFSILIILS